MKEKKYILTYKTDTDSYVYIFSACASRTKLKDSVKRKIKDKIPIKFIYSRKRRLSDGITTVRVLLDTMFTTSLPPVPNKFILKELDEPALELYTEFFNDGNGYSYTDMYDFMAQYEFKDEKYWENK